jgi:hypothetical protein
MLAKAVTPILNVSNFHESIAWFEKLGWTKGFQWGEPPTFGAVCSGEFEIFLCQGAQGGRGNGGVKSTFGPDGDSAADKGVWMSIWVDDVDAVHPHCVDTRSRKSGATREDTAGTHVRREVHLRSSTLKAKSIPSGSSPCRYDSGCQ